MGQGVCAQLRYSQLTMTSLPTSSVVAKINTGQKLAANMAAKPTME